MLFKPEVALDPDNLMVSREIYAVKGRMLIKTVFPVQNKNIQNPGFFKKNQSIKGLISRSPFGIISNHAIYFRAIIIFFTI